MTKADFDRLLRENRMARGEDAFGYGIPGETPWENYDRNDRYRAFVEEMRESYPAAYRRYAGGKGSELEEHTRRGRTYPPKMASAASSSRFCYLALRDGWEEDGRRYPVQFEEPCPIRGVLGTPPQLDGYASERNLYWEVKCHEIFDAHSIVLRGAYREWLSTGEEGFGLQEVREEAGQLIVPPAALDLPDHSTRFDAKQLLCHLMGIASRNRRGAELRYLFFKPRTEDPALAAQVEQVFGELTDEIRALFGSAPIRRFCCRHDIALSAAVEEDWVMGPLTPGNTVPIV